MNLNLQASLCSFYYMAKSALSNSIYYGIGSLVRSCASFFLLPLYTSILGATQYGQLNVLSTMSIILSTCMTFALERSLYRLYHDYKTDEEKSEFLSTIFIAINGIGLFVIALSLLFGSYLTPLLGGVDFMTGLLPVILYSYVHALISYCQIIQQARQDGSKFLFVSILYMLLYNIICIAFLYLYSPTYHSMVFATLIANLLVFPVAFSMIKYQIKFYFSMGILKNVLSFSMPILGMVIFSWVLHFSDRLFLANMSTLADVGLYSFAAKIVSVVVLFCGAIFKSYTPYFFSVSNKFTYDETKNRLIPLNETVTFMICLLCMILALAYNMMLHSIFSSEYQGSIDFFYFLLIGVVIGQQTGLLNVMIYQNKKSGVLAIVSIVAGVLSVLMNYILIGTIGRIGAAISNLTISILIFMANYHLAKNEYYIPFNFKILGSSIVILLVMCLVDYNIDNVYLQLLTKTLIVYLYVYIVIKSNIIDDVVLKKILNRSKTKFIKQMNNGRINH